MRGSHSDSELSCKTCKYRLERFGQERNLHPDMERHCLGACDLNHLQHDTRRLQISMLEQLSLGIIKLCVKYEDRSGMQCKTCKHRLEHGFKHNTDMERKRMDSIDHKFV